MVPVTQPWSDEVVQDLLIELGGPGVVLHREYLHAASYSNATEIVEVTLAVMNLIFSEGRLFVIETECLSRSVRVEGPVLFSSMFTRRWRYRAVDRIMMNHHQCFTMKLVVSVIVGLPENQVSNGGQTSELTLFDLVYCVCSVTNVFCFLCARRLFIHVFLLGSWTVLLVKAMLTGAISLCSLFLFVTLVHSS